MLTYARGVVVAAFNQNIGEDIMVLGIQDPGIWLAYILCIASSLLCVLWGIFKWNAEEKSAEPEEEVRHWAEEEDKVEQEL